MYMDHNSSTSSDPFGINLIDFEDVLLDQWLTESSPITPQNDAVSPPLPLEVNATVNNHAEQELAPPPPRNIAARRRCKGVAGSSSKTTEDKTKAVDIERKRRQEMSTLYRSLRSILPAEYIRGKRSTADHLHEAVKYIKDMEDNIGKLNEKRDKLLKGKSSTGSSNTSNSSNSRHLNVTVKQCREGFFEIVLKTNNADDFEVNQRRIPLSKAVRLLNREGLSVINNISSKIGNNLVHTIHAQVDDERVVDGCLLQQQVLDCYQ